MRGSAVHPDPSWAALREQTGRLFRRARRHIWIVFGVAALATLGALGVAARRPIRQSATVALRMTEDVKAAVRMPWTDRALRGYVNEVAFSHTHLLALIDRNRMFRNNPGKFDPIVAVETLRERITVEVVQNHAIALVEPGNRPRSAHLTITFQDGDPGRAVKVARQLGELVMITSRAQQRIHAEAAVRKASTEVQAARTSLASLRLEAISTPAIAPLQARTPADIPGMRDAIRLAQLRVDRAEEGLGLAERRLRGELEEGGMGVELLDLVPAPPPWPAGKKLAVVAAAAALICFPLAAMMVGAWDRRVYAAEDVRHLGLRCLGQLGLTKEET
jgi:hypothetical protein